MSKDLTNANTPADDWSEFEFEESKKSQVELFSALSFVDAMRFAIYGACAGFSAWILAQVLNFLVVRNIFCQNVDTAAICASSDSLSFYVSLGFICAIIYLLFAKKGFSRPLIIAVSTFVSLAAFWPLISGNAFTELFVLVVFGALFSVLFAKVATLLSYVSNFILSAFFVALTWIVIFAK